MQLEDIRDLPGISNISSNTRENIPPKVEKLDLPKNTSRSFKTSEKLCQFYQANKSRLDLSIIANLSNRAPLFTTITKTWKKVKRTFKFKEQKKVSMRSHHQKSRYWNRQIAKIE